MIFILQVQNNQLLFSTYFRIFPDLFLKFRKVGWNVNFFDFFHSLCQLKSSLIKQDYKEFPFSEKRKVRKFVRILWKTLADTLEMRGSLVEHVIQKERICSNICTCHFIVAHYFDICHKLLVYKWHKIGQSKKNTFLNKVSRQKSD